MKIRNIIADEANFQLRAETDARWVQELSEKMRLEGFKADKPLVIFKKGGSWVLIDGFHRHRAAILAGITEVPTIQFQGTEAEALAEGFRQNVAHGMKLDPNVDFKMAANKLYAAGVMPNHICDILFGKMRTSYKAHPKTSVIRRWLRIKDTIISSKRDKASTSAGRKAVKRARAILPEDFEIADITDPDVVDELVQKASKSEKEKAKLEGFQQSQEMLQKALSAPVITPAWSVPENVTPNSPGIPVLFLSDIHAGEVVNQIELSGYNAYNWDLMQRRLDTVFSTSVALLKRHLAYPEYNGIHVVLGGDMLSGEIHEELIKTNEKCNAEVVTEFPPILIGHLRKLADEFGKVHIVGVAGNHGRNSKKPEAKMYTATNWDHAIYRTMQHMIEISGDDRFTFNIPLSRDCRFDVAGRRFLLTHGDQFRGGDGIIGALGPIMRGSYKKLTKATMQPDRPDGLDSEFDTMMLGHWHQTIMLPSLIVNGSLKGYDEYAESGNFRPERPSQTLFTVHPKHGITWYMPVLAYPFV